MNGLPENPKWLDWPDAIARRAELRNSGSRMVMTNGVFDLLHPGHIAFLQEARKQGDNLWVALNSDVSVRELKGPKRPVLRESERAFAIAALACVDAVLVFRGPRLEEEIRRLAPDVYVKAGDYMIETLHPGERAALESVQAEIRFLPFVKGFSTTGLIERIVSSYGELQDKETSCES